MAKNYTIKQTISLIEDSVEKRRDDANIVTNITESVEHNIVVEKSASDLVIDFGGVVDGLLLIIITDLKITVKINGSLVPLPVNSFLLLTADNTDSITSLTVTNPSGTTDANVRIIVGG